MIDRNISQEYESPDLTRRVYALYSGRTNSVFDEQLDAHELVAQLSTHHTTVASWLAGSICLDQAITGNLSEDEQIQALGKAKHHWQSAIGQSNDSEQDTFAALKAQMGLASLLPYGRLVVAHEMPTLRQEQKTYESVINIAQAVAVLRARNLNQVGKNELTRDCSGFMGELTVMALVQRFGIRELGDGSMFALPAALSQDIGNKKRVRARQAFNKWDVSVYATPSPPPS